MTDVEINSAYELHRAQARGEAVGNEGDTPTEAAEREGWTVIRKWDSRNELATNVIADDGIGRIWAICIDNGPWGIIIGEDE